MEGLDIKLEGDLDFMPECKQKEQIREKANQYAGKFVRIEGLCYKTAIQIC